MVRYRRNKTRNPDDIFFLAIVCANRHPYFNNPEKLEIVLAAMKRISSRFNLEYKAWVILPDHLHLLLEPGKVDYSKVVPSLKRMVTTSMRNRGFAGTRTAIWQDRFWEHTIRDDDDYQQCVGYIHYNPVKHGLVSTPVEWQYSSIHQFIRDGLYGDDWGNWVKVDIDGAEYDSD